MTRFSVFSRALALAGFGSGLALAAVSVSAQQQQQAPQAMPTPRYQTPGIAAPSAPVPSPVFPATPAITPNGQVAEEVIVRVNDQIISRSDLMRGEELLQQEIAQGGAQAGDASERQRNLLRDLIDQQLLISKAKELNINPDAELTRRLDEIRKQNNLPSMEALEQAAQRQGVSYEDFKANIRNQIMTQSVVRDEVGRNIHMTHADEEKYYQAHLSDFAMPEQVKLSEILVPVGATASDAEIEQAKTKADGIYTQLKGGADFAATAKSSSGGPTAAQGGDLGVFKRGQLAKVLEDRTFAQQPGEFTEPIRTRQGFVILKTVDHIQAGTPTLDKIEPDVQNAMYQDQIQPALRAYLTKLREDSYVDVRPGFVDSGASAKQTKPVFTAYTAPQPKKKTENKRRLIAQRDRARLQDAGLTVKGNSVQPLANVQLDKHGKPKKVKREKVRFGQAPREALPDENTDTAATTTSAGTREPSASGQDALGMPGTNPAVAANGVNAGAFGSGSGTGAQGASTAGNGAPGTALAPVTTTNTVNVAEASDPLTPVAPPRKKTRFSDREPEVKEKKKEVKVDKTIARVTSRPDAASTAEKQDAAAQQTALGLNGDTNKKKKKRQKGEAKERLQQTTPEKKPELVDNGLPDRLHQQNGPQQTTGTPSASSATGNLPAENSKEADKQRRGRQPVTDPAKDSTTLPTDAQPPAGTTLPAGTPTQNGTTTPGPGTLSPNPTAPPQ